MYIKLNEQNQSIEYPPINKDNICNYNMDIELLLADGYVDIQQNLIDLFNQGKGKIENNTIIDISQAPEYIAEQEAKEQERIANLKMTPRDFLLGLIDMGASYSDIKALIAQNEQAELELNYCQNVYRGNPLLDSLCEIIGVSPQQLDDMFNEKGQ